MWEKLMAVLSPRELEELRTALSHIVTWRIDDLKADRANLIGDRDFFAALYYAERALQQVESSM